MEFRAEAMEADRERREHVLWNRESCGEER